MTQQEASWVASLSMLGAWFGAMIGDWVMRRGRRLALRVTSLPLAVVWILTGIAPCVELVYVTSFIGGLCCSVITMVAQVYLYIYMYTRFFRVDLVSRLIFPGIHIGNLDAGHQGLPVGYAEGAGPRGRVVVVHSRHVLELEAKRPPGGNSALDALFGDPVYTRDAVVSRSERERRRGCEQLAVAARRSRRHTSRAPGNVFKFPCDDSTSGRRI